MGLWQRTELADVRLVSVLRFFLTKPAIALSASSVFLPLRISFCFIMPLWIWLPVLTDKVHFPVCEVVLLGPNLVLVRLQRRSLEHLFNPVSLNSADSQ